MTDNKRKKSKFKSIVGLVVPLLVMAISVSVIGVSFAWFSVGTSVEIATINLSFADIFTLRFEIDDNIENMYNGQTAVMGSEMNTSGRFPIGADGGRLVNRRWALDTANGGLGLSPSDASFGRYIADSPYIASFPMRLNTDGRAITLEVSFEAMSIKKYSGEGRDRTEITSLTIEMPSVVEEGEVPTYDKSDICYGFTWFLVVNGVTYSPYGSLGENFAASSESGAGTFFENASLPNKTALENFYAELPADSQAANCTFYIVFAPERLYWMQYFENDWTKTKAGGTIQKIAENGTVTNYQTGNAYSQEELNSSAWDYLKYSSQAYAGAEFNFTVLLEVLDKGVPSV